MLKQYQKMRLNYLSDLGPSCLLRQGSRGSAHRWL
uniref:Uncharacterized protein n=1 Tax=Anguilla anguilla TaxID=7936 RepID=A0A0E9S7D7_ANGAN